LAGTAVSSASAESLFQSSNSLAERVVLGFDELHLASVGGGIGVVLHGDLDVWAWALGGRGRGLRAVVWRAGCCCYGSGVAVVSREGRAVGESVGRAAACDSSGCGVGWVAVGVEALAGGSRGAALG
jgi:hypothetical protein